MKFDYEKLFSGTRVRCHFVLLCTANNLCVFLTRTHTLKSHGCPSAALACCFTSTTPLSTSTPRLKRQKKKNFSECDRREWYLSLLLFFFRLFHAPAFRLNSVSNGSLNKVFRKRAVCSPFPGPSEWLSVSAAGRAAHAQMHKHTSTHTPLEFRGGRSQNLIQDHFSDINVAVTAVTAVNAPFLCFLWTRPRWKAGSGTFLCHDTVRHGSVKTLRSEPIWKQAVCVRSSSSSRLHLHAAVSKVRAKKQKKVCLVQI